MRGAARQLLSFVRKPKEKMFWWYTHLGNFIGSYIAAWSAFSVGDAVASDRESLVCVAVAAMVGVPAIAITTAYYKRKFAPRVKVVT